jgi:hypothetical protein
MLNALTVIISKFLPDTWSAVWFDQLDLDIFKLNECKLRSCITGFPRYMVGRLSCPAATITTGVSMPNILA